MRIKYISILIAILTITLVAACSSSQSSSQDVEGQVSEQTQGSSSSQQRLTVYVGFQEDHALAAMEKFTEDTGIEVDMIRMSAGEILAKIRAEQDNPQADIWYGGPADTFVYAKNEGLLQPYISPVAEVIDPMYKDEEGYWTGIYIGVMGFATSQDFLDRTGLEAPKTWQDLLKPEFKNEIIMSHPNSSGAAYTVLYTILQAMGGEEEGFEYLKQLHPQIQQYSTSGLAPGRMVGMNEAGIGILFSHDTIKYQEEGFENLILTIPEDGAGYEIGAIAIVNNAPNLELAKQFVDWALGPEAQEIGQQTGSYQNLTHPDAKQPEKAINLDDVNTVNYDPVESGKVREHVIERWGKEIND